MTPAELAPRDVVARAIAHELELVKRPDAAVYLDLTHLNADRVRKRFPTIYSTCMQYNIDITSELVPIRPAAHYAMGGVRTDLRGQTSLTGLYAAGEVACTGVHGANRLASNSLLEGLVYGARAAQAMREHLRSHREHAPVAGADNTAAPADGQPAQIEAFIKKVQSLMWQYVGVVRDGKGLRQVVSELSTLQKPAACLGRSSFARSGEHPPSRTADCPFRTGPGGEPRRPLSPRLPPQERLEVPQAFRRLGRQDPLPVICYALLRFLLGNNSDSRIEISKTPATTPNATPIGICR